MPCTGVAFEEPEGVLDGIDERPVELEQLVPGATREDDAGQRSAGSPALCQLATKVLERDCLISGELGQAGFQGGEGFGVREDLGGLFERLVLVDRYEHGGRPAIAGDEHVVAAISDIAEQPAQVASKLTDGNCFCHRAVAYTIAYIPYRGVCLVAGPLSRRAGWVAVGRVAG